MQNTFSDFETAEAIFPAFNALIAGPRPVTRVFVPAEYVRRAIYLFVEGIPSAVVDWRIDGIVRCKRGESIVAEFPASIGDNSGGGLAVSSVTFFANVAAGAPEGILVNLASPLAGGGASAVSLTPQRIECECDEIEFSVLGSQATGGATFTGWRVFLAVRSTK